MLMRAPLVEAEQDSSIRIEDLTKIGMARSCLGLAEERLVPFEAIRDIAYADDRPGAFHEVFSRRPKETSCREPGHSRLRVKKCSGAFQFQSFEQTNIPMKKNPVFG